MIILMLREDLDPRAAAVATVNQRGDIVQGHPVALTDGAEVVATITTAVDQLELLIGIIHQTAPQTVAATVTE